MRVEMKMSEENNDCVVTCRAEMTVDGLLHAVWDHWTGHGSDRVPYFSEVVVRAEDGTEVKISRDGIAVKRSDG